MPVELTDSEMRDLSSPKKSDPDAGEQKYEPTEREKTAPTVAGRAIDDLDLARAAGNISEV